MFYPWATKNCDTEFDMFIEVNRKTFVKLYDCNLGNGTMENALI